MNTTETFFKRTIILILMLIALGSCARPMTPRRYELANFQEKEVVKKGKAEKATRWVTTLAMINYIVMYSVKY